MKYLLIFAAVFSLNLFPCSQSYSYQKDGPNYRFQEISKNYISAHEKSTSVVEVSYFTNLTGPTDVASCFTRIFHSGIYDVKDKEAGCVTRVSVENYTGFGKNQTSYLQSIDYDKDTGEVIKNVKKLDLFLSARVISKKCD